MTVRDYKLMLPNVFSLSVDRLLCKLEEEGDESQHLTMLAFADNFILLSQSWDGMQILFPSIFIGLL